MARGGGDSAVSRIYDGIGSFFKVSLGVGFIFGPQMMVALVGLVLVLVATLIGAIVHDLPHAIGIVQSMKVGVPSASASTKP